MFSSFMPRDSSYKFKHNSLWLKVNKFKHKDIKPRPKDNDIGSHWHGC